MSNSYSTGFISHTVHIVYTIYLLFSSHVGLSTPVLITFSAVLTLQHTITPSEYESVLAGDDIVNLAVVIKDIRTEERVLATQEFNISSSQITIKVKQHTSGGFVYLVPFWHLIIYIIILTISALEP